MDGETRIVCLGDSVTGVYYHTGGQRAYPEMLELALNARHSDNIVRVINAGVSGNTTSDGLARLEADVLQHRPNIVTISFGLNDMVRVPADQFRLNLEQLIDRCRAEDSLVVLCTPNAVINTEGRPIVKLEEYCEIIRTVAIDKHVTVCDQYLAGERLKERAPWTWRLTMSDVIHPNMDGHKRMAEELYRCLIGSDVCLDQVEPPAPNLAKTRKQLSEGATIRVLAMEPLAASVEAAIRRVNANAKIELTLWVTTGKTLTQLEQEANATVRALKPDLVVLTIPADAQFESDEQFVHSVSWIMNWSLSFGRQEWDCVVVHPSVFTPVDDPAKADLIRRLVHAQHLGLIDRTSEPKPSDEVMNAWFASELLSDKP